MRALIAARHLMCAASLRKNADVDMLHVSPRYRERDEVLGFTSSGAGVTTNATRLVDYFGPLHRAVLWFFEHETPCFGFGESELYHAMNKSKHAHYSATTQVIGWERGRDARK
jgi:hypothetical protein